MPSPARKRSYKIGWEMLFISKVKEYVKKHPIYKEHGSFSVPIERTLLSLCQKMLFAYLRCESIYSKSGILYRPFEYRVCCEKPSSVGAWFGLNWMDYRDSLRGEFNQLKREAPSINSLDQYIPYNTELDRLRSKLNEAQSKLDECREYARCKACESGNFTLQDIKNISHKDVVFWIDRVWDSSPDYMSAFIDEALVWVPKISKLAIMGRLEGLYIERHRNDPGKIDKLSEIYERMFPWLKAPTEISRLYRDTVKGFLVEDKRTIGYGCSMEDIIILDESIEYSWQQLYQDKFVFMDTPIM